MGSDRLKKKSLALLGNGVRSRLEPQIGRLFTDGAELHAMTDYQPVAEQYLELLEEDKRFVNLEGPGGGVCHRPGSAQSNCLSCEK